MNPYIYIYTLLTVDYYKEYKYSSTENNIQINIERL